MKKALKSSLALLLTALLLFGAAPMAGLAGIDLKWPNLFTVKANAETEGIYTYTVSYGGATITDCDSSASGAITIPFKLGGYSVRSIQHSAFYGCTSLTSVTIPGCVTSIGYGAFSGCTGLTTVNIPSSVTSIELETFSGCTGLTSITIPNSVTSIGSSAFHDCTGLTSVNIGSGLSSINTSIFFDSRELSQINVDSANLHYSSQNGVLFNKNGSELIWFPWGKAGAYSIPNSVKIIYTGAFKNCIGLTSVTIPNSVTGIGEYGFRGCTGLTSVTIPASVTYISSYAFYGCTTLNTVYFNAVSCSSSDSVFVNCPSLQTINIGGSVTRIPAYFFSYCTYVTSVTIPDSVTYISYRAFYKCTSLTNVTIPNSVTALGGDVESSPQGEVFSGCVSLKSVSLGSGLKHIMGGTFSGCTSLASITFPGNIKGIWYNAFSGCTSLTSITIPSNIASIGTYAFYGCSKLTQIYVDSENSYYSSAEGVLFNKLSTKLIQYPTGKTEATYKIPNSVTSIESKAFSGCVGLRSITIPSSVTNIGSGAFEGCSNLVIYCFPDSRAATYANDFGIPFILLPPVAPTGLIAIDKIDTTVSLSWNASEGATGYNVYRGTTKLTDTPITETNYIAAGLTQKTIYTFTVKAVNMVGESPASVPLSVTTNPTVPTAPVNLMSPGKTDTTITLSWSPSTFATGYNVYRGTTKLTASPIGSTSYTATGLMQNSTYNFTVTAVNAGVESTASVPLSVTTDKTSSTTPATPTNFKAISASYNSIKLSWNVVSGASGYVLYRYNASTKKYDRIKVTSSTSYIDTDRTTGREYLYKVRAYRTISSTTVYGNPSAAVKGKAIPSVPTNFKATRYSATSIKLTWSPVAGASGYVLYKYNAITKTWNRLKVLTGTSYINTGLTKGATYYYKVRAYRMVSSSPVYGNPTAAISAKTY